MQMAAAAMPVPAVETQLARAQERWYSSMAGVIVASLGLLVLFGVVAVAITTLPDDETKAQNVVALASTAFGLVGTIVGAYFGVRAANRAVDKMHSNA
jgi:uncharacterized membrane protein